MDTVQAILAILGSNAISSFLTFRLTNKKTDLDAFKTILNEYKEDNERLRSSNSALTEKVLELERHVDQVSLKLQLMESSQSDIPVPAWLKDTHGRMLFINRAYTDVFGKTWDEYVGKTDWDVWEKDIAREFGKNDSEVYKTGQPIHIVESILMPSGHMEEWEILKYPRYAGNSTIVIGIGGIAWKRKGDYSWNMPSVPVSPDIV